MPIVPGNHLTNHSWMKSWVNLEASQRILTRTPKLGIQYQTFHCYWNKFLRFFVYKMAKIDILELLKWCCQFLGISSQTQSKIILYLSLATISMQKYLINCLIPDILMLKQSGSLIAQEYISINNKFWVRHWAKNTFLKFE